MCDDANVEYFYMNLSGLGSKIHPKAFAQTAQKFLRSTGNVAAHALVDSSYSGNNNGARLIVGPVVINQNQDDKKDSAAAIEKITRLMAPLVGTRSAFNGVRYGFVPYARVYESA